MTSSYSELIQIADALGKFADRAEKEEIQQLSQRLGNAARDVAKAWSGSWYGYQANVYYRDFQSPPHRATFSRVKGLHDQAFPKRTVGAWVEYDAEKVNAEIHKIAGHPETVTGQTYYTEASTAFKTHQIELLSIIDVELSRLESPLLKTLQENAQELSIVTYQELLEKWQPKRLNTEDHAARRQGLRTPPHVPFIFFAVGIRSVVSMIKELATLARQAAMHLSRLHRHVRSDTSATKVFIGHGHSPIWRELKEFVEERLQLPADEFNRVPTAGVSTKERLSEMLDEAVIAFLIMTGEDELADGNRHARANVIHEAGLFQGRLGFERAIVLLEEDCEEFSNIDGLGQIRFPRNNIRAAFEEIRRVVEREGLGKSLG